MEAITVQRSVPEATIVSDEAHLKSLTKKYDKMVRQLARIVSYSVSGRVEIDDLVQIGVAALISASRTFVDRGEACFSTYARTRVRGAMIDETRKYSMLSRGQLRMRRDLNALRSRLNAELGRAPSNAEMAEAAGVTLHAYMQICDRHNGAFITSIDGSYSDTNPCFTDQTPGADELLESMMSAEALAEAINMLPERQRLVLQMYFVEECSLAEIGQILNVGEARVCQIKKSALIALRSKVAGWA